MTCQERSSPASKLTAKAFALYVAAFFLIWSLRAIVFIRIDEGIESPVTRNVHRARSNSRYGSCGLY
jgi:hypothetical protein